MARIRTIKPEFFTHEALYEAEKETGLPLRLAYSGLWCQCDREGRFKWRPRELKLGILPYDDVDFARVLDALLTRGWLVRYASGTDVFGHIPSFLSHQQINNRESSSALPAPPKPSGNNPNTLPTRQSHVEHASTTGEARDTRGKEGKGKELKSPILKHTSLQDSAPATPEPGVATQPEAPPAPEGVRVMPSPHTLTPEQRNLVDLVVLGSPPGIVAGLTAGAITPAHRVPVITAAKREAQEHAISTGEAIELLRQSVEAQASAIPQDRLNLLGGFEKYFNQAKYRMDPVHVQERKHANRRSGTIDAVRTILAKDKSRASASGVGGAGSSAWLLGVATGRTGTTQE